MSEKTELKPCSCGGRAVGPFSSRRIVKLFQTQDGESFWPLYHDLRQIRCAECGKEICCSHKSDNEMIAAWNRRPIEDAQAARIAELERLVDDLRGELAQSDRVADKARIAELENGNDELMYF